MFFPLLSFPEIIRQGAKPYQHLFASEESFVHCQRYLTGLMVSDNKSIEGITNIFAQDIDFHQYKL